MLAGMICFQVMRNGKRLATAGSFENGGVLSFDMTRVTGSQRNPSNSNRFNLWGGDWSVNPNEVVTWCSGDLAVGDELVVRVIESTNPDAPAGIGLKVPHPDEAIEKARKDIAELEQEARFLRRTFGLL